jgi:hypothetical protein
MSLPPQVTAAIQKVDAFMEKYPTLTQYGTCIPSAKEVVCKSGVISDYRSDKAMIANVACPSISVVLV